MKKSLNNMLQEKLLEAKPSKKEIDEISRKAKEVIGKLKRAISQTKSKATAFIGGSLAKGTIVRKKINDVDIFLRFGNEEEISKFSKIMSKTREKYKIIHGSRDYAQIRKGNLIFEIIPTSKVKSPKKAGNITDLSYFHVNYVLKKLRKNKNFGKDKSQKTHKNLIDEIILAKAFCYAAGAYGAESYIRGFSGYAVELLIIEYRTFLNFIRAMGKFDSKTGDKLVIDIESHYKGRKIMREINEAKLSSPIILVDPTFKERNALAALSKETFERFREHCIKFLKAPSAKFFDKKEIEVSKLKSSAKKAGRDFAVIEIKTNKQAGDVAGTKLLKFANLFKEEMKRYYGNPEINFEYDEGQKGRIYFTGKKIREKVIRGPPIEIDKAIDMERFRKKYGKSAYERNGRLMAKARINADFKDALKGFRKMHSKTMKEMGIMRLEEE